MKTQDIRKAFVEYFKKNAHTAVASSSLVPASDPSLLFTNSGMVQFKDYFLGNVPAPYPTAVSVQRCVRAGGKHNDLENVGYTARHHTFFEMLGNFSFGDYFKEQAILYAWDFLTKELKLPKKKLWVTVYKDDKEAEAIWIDKMKIDPKRFSRCDEDNFWAMGDTGPCGPCSEIFYDHGESVPGAPPGFPGSEGDRYTEIWNLVFMQFARDASGKLMPLPKPSVDTGMGLERISAAMQGVFSNYEIDLFRELIVAVRNYVPAKPDEPSLKVIADHMRAIVFLIQDGVRPSNEGRGYVLRRIMRRAVRHGFKQGQHQPFLYLLVSKVVELMKAAYPEVVANENMIAQVVKHEEKLFAGTLAQGMKILSDTLQNGSKLLSGQIIFKLYDTYGFPVDLTQDIAREQGLKLDLAGFEQLMHQQKERSQKASQFKDMGNEVNYEGETEFIGYESFSAEAEILSLWQGEQAVTELNAGGEAAVILDRTPFYAESGGQVGDKGVLLFDGGEFQVNDTQKKGMVYLHLGKLLKGKLKPGVKVTAEVDSIRFETMLNHSATHLLHEALRRVLGTHVIQKGSLVAPDRLRFDFAHFKALTREEIEQVEDLVNQQIRANLTSKIEYLSLEQAKKRGAMALFDEKYGDQVRVLSMGEFSTELCGGTHVDKTGDIGLFKIIQETGIASGVRRIEALTGKRAFQRLRQLENQQLKLSAMLKAQPDELEVRLEQQLAENRELRKQLEQFVMQKVRELLQDSIKNLNSINEIKLIFALLPEIDAKQLREAAEDLKNQAADYVIVLFAPSDARLNYVVAVSKELNDIAANELLNWISEELQGKGGGRADLAQGSANIKDINYLKPKVEQWLKLKIEA